MYRARKLFLLNIRRVVRIQCLWRVKVARGRFRILRAEARDVNKMKSLNKGLENKIMELKRKSDDKAAKVKELEALLAKGQFKKMKSKLDFLDKSAILIKGLLLNNRVSFQLTRAAS